MSSDGGYWCADRCRGYNDLLFPPHENQEKPETQARKVPETAEQRTFLACASGFYADLSCRGNIEPVPE
jgi:hypothetical protein